MCNNHALTGWLRFEHFFTLFAILLIYEVQKTEAVAEKCVWFYTIAQRRINIRMHHTHWESSKCPGGLVRYQPEDINPNSVGPVALLYLINFMPRASPEFNNTRYAYIDIKEQCDQGIDHRCSSAVVHYAVAPDTKDLNEVGLPNSTTCSTEYRRKPIYVPVHSVLTLNILSGIEDCANPVLEVLSQTKGPYNFTLSQTLSGEPVIDFNTSGTNIRVGDFDAKILISCGVNATRSFILDQRVIVTPTSDFSQHASDILGASFVVPEVDRVPDIKVRKEVCNLQTLQHNDDWVGMHYSSRDWSFLRSMGWATTLDSGPLKVQCRGQEGAPSNAFRFSRGVEKFEDSRPTILCPGNFDYLYTRNVNGTFLPTVASLLARLPSSSTGFSPTNRLTSATLLTQPRAGSIRDFNASEGTFVYIPSTPGVVGMDFFNFSLRCAGDPATVCQGTARIFINSGPLDQQFVSHEEKIPIRCQGTCPNGSSVRKDGRPAGLVEFDITQNGKLLIYAYMTLDSLRSDFVSLVPFVNGSGFLTSETVPSEALVSFESSCLNRQSADGKAADVVLPNHGGLNLDTGYYKRGDNFYQKFGGMHVECDLYQVDSCKFAPFMTPKTYTNSSGVPAVTWELHIDGCDATYVGTASVKSLRALKTRDGTSVFGLSNDATLTGTIYMNTIIPISLELPAEGFLVRYKTYDLNVSIRSTIAVQTSEVKEAGEGAVRIVSDVQYAFGRDVSTNERLYVYAIHMYPRLLVDGKMISVDTNEIFVQVSSLVYFEFLSPNRVECPECTGTRAHCTGLGRGFETDCGKDGVVTFEAFDAKKIRFSHLDANSDDTQEFPRVTSDIGSYYNLIFTIRVNGWNSSNSVDAAPSGFYIMHIKLSNNQLFSITVNQSDYVSLVNNHYLHPRVCSTTPYWPVPDPFGNSTPITPFRALVFADERDGIVQRDDYSVPEPLIDASMCDAPFSNVSTDVFLPSLDAVLSDGAKNTTVSLCTHDQACIFGVKDWVFITIPGIKQNRHSVIVTGGSTSNTTYTVAEVEFFFLSVPINETIAAEASQTEDTPYLNILLDGSVPAQKESLRLQASRNGFGFGQAQERYYSWKKVASFLKYRRLSYEAAAAGEEGITVPMNFALTPGTLLHYNSSINVPVYLHLSIKFKLVNRTKNEVKVISETREHFFYILHLTRGISAATQFDTQAYQIAMTRLEGALGRKSARVLFILLIIAVICTLIGSIYIEVKYKRIIHECKYRTKRMQRSLERAPEDGGVDFNSSSVSSMERDGGNEVGPPSLNLNPPFTHNKECYSTCVTTRFGTIDIESLRVPDDSIDDNLDISTINVEIYSRYPLPPAQEQERVQDDEIANFSTV